jgi:peptidyl-dipeptidase Dcp
MRLFQPGVLLAVSIPVTAQTPPARVNPLLSPSTLPYQAPPFDRIADTDYLPAMEEGIRRQLAEVADIASNTAAPTFANTIEAMERTGTLLHRVTSVFFSLTSANTNPVLQQAEREISPKLAAASDEIYLNPTLFARVKAIYDRRASLTLDPESAHLVELYYRDFVRAGALMNDDDKQSSPIARCSTA